jgi:uncharacterized protein
VVIDTEYGPGTAEVDSPDVDAGGSARFLMVLTHGAGGGVDAPDLLAVRDAAVSLGGAVARVVQPYRVRGARAPGSAARQDAAWLEVITALRAGYAGIPLVQGGRSNGARVACRTARAVGAQAVLALAFPLHPPGKPEKSRAGELLDTGVPTLVVQGGADTFGTASEFPKLPWTHRLVGLPAGDHSFKVKKADPPVLDALVAAVAEWIDALLR